MTRQSQRRTPKNASAGRERRAAWVRPFRRVHRALDASVRLIAASLDTAERSGRCAPRRPIHSSQNLNRAADRLAVASSRLVRAARELAATNRCIAREPERAAGAPELLIQATQRLLFTSVWLNQASDEIFTLHSDVLERLATGELVPERSSGGPRIVLARPAPLRAFLSAREPRATDRVSTVLHRRRRTPRPASVSVPRRTWQGRAPPLSPLCSL